MTQISKEHRYEIKINWAGNQGTGTSGYAAYKRDHIISAGAKPDILGSSDPSFRGNQERWNPEELLVAAISACHKLWYLHLCSVAGITVVAYGDTASGTMLEDETGSGHFDQVTLRPQVTISKGSDVVLAKELHDKAHAKCFIANSVNFPITHQPIIASEGL